MVSTEAESIIQSGREEKRLYALRRNTEGVKVVGNKLIKISITIVYIVQGSVCSKWFKRAKKRGKGEIAESELCLGFLLTLTMRNEKKGEKKNPVIFKKKLRAFPLKGRK